MELDDIDGKAVAFCDKKRYFINDIPLRFSAKHFFIQEELKNTTCETLINYFKKSGSTALQIFLAKGFGNEDGLCCTPENFNRLLEVAQITEFECHQTLRLEYLRQPALLKCHNIVAKGPMTDSDLPKLSSVHISIDEANFTEKGINAFLKEWQQNKRNIIDADIFLPIGFKEDLILADFSYTTSDFKIAGIEPIKRYKISRGDGDDLEISFGHDYINIQVPGDNDGSDSNASDADESEFEDSNMDVEDEEGSIWVRGGVEIPPRLNHIGFAYARNPSFNSRTFYDYGSGADMEDMHRNPLPSDFEDDFFD